MSQSPLLGVRTPEGWFALVPKQFSVGSSSFQFPVSRFAKLELRLRGSQSGDWEPVTPARMEIAVYAISWAMINHGLFVILIDELASGDGVQALPAAQAKLALLSFILYVLLPKFNSTPSKPD